MPGAGRVVEFVRSGAEAATVPSGHIAVVLDAGWSPGPGEPSNVHGLRAYAAGVLERHDLFVETSALLDGWAARSGIVDLLAAAGISLWHRRRLAYWWWLHEHLLWLGVLEAIDAGAPITAYRVPSGETALATVAGLVARRDGAELSIGAAPALGADARAGSSGARPDPSGSSRPRGRRRGGLAGALGALAMRWTVRRRNAALARQFDALMAGGPGRLVVLSAPGARQRVETPSGPRWLNPFIGPVVGGLSASPLDPIVVALESGAETDGPRSEAAGEHADRSIPDSILQVRYGRPGDLERSTGSATAIADDLVRVTTPLDAEGVDLGPALVEELRRSIVAILPGRLRDLGRIRSFLTELRPAAVLMVNEYGHSEWTAAGRQAGVRIAALQHGIIHRWHPGYVFPDRPAALPIPDRTYVFGRYERRLLVENSVYQPHEVVVVGSPRLDLLADPDDAGQRTATRAALGVSSSERLLVISTTSAEILRRFYTTTALDRLIDRPLPDVHLVVKLHPGERDGALYEDLVRGLAAERGFLPPRITIVKDIDLYRLLAAADAHLGIYSTVLTEAVVVGVPNLVAVTQATSDLLGYVDAGVAIPVRDGAELLAALARGPAAAPDPAARAAFLAEHFEPGSAVDRIRTDLLAWLVPAWPASSGAEGRPAATESPQDG